MKKQSYSRTLFCFSPPVMMATFILEVVLALYTFFTSKGPIARLIIVLLLCLASFQLAEYMVCLGPISQRSQWTVFGLVAITFLPALGMHLAGLLTKKTGLIGFGYGIAATLSVAFILQPEIANAPYCLGNYVLVDIHNLVISTIHSWFYATFLFIMAMQLFLAEQMFGKVSRSVRRAQLWLLLGILSFTLPMTIVFHFSPEAHQGTISIMCGFAVILAIILGLAVAPLAKELDIKTKE